jgi:tryptophanyl-tRNA synthetase
MKPIILSGIQPSGRLHIGNYLGALKNFVDLQNSGQYDCFFMIADLHSLTETYAVADKKTQLLDLASTYLSAGFDPKKSVQFFQSHISAHTELAWILNTITPMGELERMTQYKDKSGRMETNAGLFTYPALMASDILLYSTTLVPVGDDQDQHLELTRTLARKFNGKFGQTFPEPKALHTETPRIMSLDNPEKKMSKSQPSGCLFLDDEPEVIRKKVMSAVTDSGSEVKLDETNKPGVSNLLRIMKAVTGKSIEQLEAEFAGKQYGAFKSAVADTLIAYLAPIRERKAELLKSPKKVLKAFAKGEKRARKVAEQKLAEVYEKVGLI